MKDLIQTELEERKRKRAELDVELEKVSMELKRKTEELNTVKKDVEERIKSLELVLAAKQAIMNMTDEEKRHLEKAADDPKTLGIFTEIKPMSSVLALTSVDQMVESAFQTPGPLAVEKIYIGMDVRVHKKGTDVKIMDGEGRDLGKHFVETCYELSKISLNDFVIDGTLCQYDGRKIVNLENFKKEGFDESTISIHVHDIPYFGKDVRDLTWVDRRKLFEEMKWSNRVRESAVVVVDSPEKAKDAIQLVCGLSGSCGARAKKYESKYLSEDESPVWFVFKFEKEEEEGPDCQEPDSNST